ncbi:MAG: class I SAM-dependent methyltransferase [Polyangiaceae bacterium]
MTGYRETLHYMGCDVVVYDRFPTDAWASFRKIDLDVVPYDVPDASAALVLCVEAIEHVENPRALMRELVRIAKPGARVIVTTPNQLSVLSKLPLLTKNEFVAFQEAPGLHRAHITALFEKDLRRIASECGDRNSLHGLGPHSFTGRRFSYNVLLSARTRS